MNKRILIAGLVSAGLLGTVMLWPEDQAPEPPKKVAAPASSSKYSFRPQESDRGIPYQRYGTAVAPQAPMANDAFRPAAPDYYGYPSVEPSPYRPVQPESSPLERFSFRPLSKRERQKLEAERPDPYYNAPPAAAPSSQPYATRSDQPAPRAYRQNPGYPDWRGDGYSYRPTEPTYSEWDSRRSPNRDWRGEQNYQDTWSEPPAAQWGSQPRDWAPPAQRMYPTLNSDPSRRFSAR